MLLVLAYLLRQRYLLATVGTSVAWSDDDLSDGNTGSENLVELRLTAGKNLGKGLERSALFKTLRHFNFD